MKNLFLVSLFVIAILSLSFVYSTERPNQEKQCTVYVKWYSTSGSPAKGKKVVGYTSTHILSTEGTNIAYTDNKGKVILHWDSYKDLKIMYIDGTKHEGTWEDGETYTFVLD
ncbi:MAG: hypothetical protein U9N85_10560 [Bacteroidota bacterium]|nr:hypothetical protein [Bacteroidota bacterium]